MSNAILTKAEQIARGEIGYREGPKNNETRFGAWFGMNFQAWCAIFQSWVSFFSGTTYLGKPWRFASTISARDHAKKNKRWITTPTVGTIAMMAHSSTTGHVGFVIYLLNRSGQIIVGTIEGNTNDQGAREGNGVWLREREVGSWDGYIVLDQTYLNEEEDDMFEQPDRDTANATRTAVAQLVAVAHRDIDTLAPLISEVLQAVKDDASSGTGAGDVTPEDFVAALKAAL